MGVCFLARGGDKSTSRIMVGIFIHNYRWGVQIRGDERGYLEKVKEYKSKGIEFFTVEKHPSIQEGVGGKIYVSLELGNCSIPPVDIGQLAKLTLQSLKAAVRRYPSRPMAIYAYNQDIENLWVGFLLKKALGSPLVVIHHQIRPAAFTSFRDGVRDRVRRGFNPAGAVLRSILPALNRYAATHADVHIALSEATRSDVERYLGIGDCTVIGNGLDTQRFKPMDLPKEYDAVFLGRLAHQKGVDVLLQAWRLVIRQESDAKLLLIGGGDPEDVSKYKNMAKELDLEKNVMFAGFVGDEQLVRLMNSSDLFVFPSRMEGFAQAVSQAMGCGLCCILSDIPSLKGIYGSAAAFSPLDDTLALSNKILDLLANENERRDLGKSARRLAESFSWDETVRQELLALSRRRGAR
jgi:glycosyltransferase involved in cell wall biosynthesis